MRSEFYRLAAVHAKELASKHGALMLLMSGGIQSEWLARMLQTEAVPFQALIYRIDSANIHDILRGIQHCESNGISYRVVDWDLRTFLKEKIYSLSQEFKINDPERLIAIEMCRMARQMGQGYVIRASGIPRMRLKDGGLVLVEKWKEEQAFGLENFSSFDFAFFSGSDDLKNAYLAHPLFKKWVELIPQMGFEDSQEWREIVLRSEFEELEPRIRWTSYEHAAQELLEVKNELLRR